jgi:hypothetical protein
VSPRVRPLVLSVGLLVSAGVLAVSAAALPTAAPRFVSGTYRATVADGSPVYHAIWNITVTGKGLISGKSHWTCCPGPRVDPLTGHVNGTRVVIIRHCTSQGAGYCLQTFTGTVGATGTVQGHWTGTGVGQPNNFTLKRIR